MSITNSESRTVLRASYSEPVDIAIHLGGAGQARMRVRGELDVAAAPLLGEAVEMLAAANRNRIIVDLAAATFCDCACLGRLAHADAMLRRNDGIVRLTNPNRQVMRLVELANLRHIVISDPLGPPRLAQPNGRPAHVRLPTLADALARLSAQPGVQETLDAIGRLGTRIVDGADRASITIRRPSGRFETEAATDATAVQVDAVQCRLAAGPCVEIASGRGWCSVVDDFALDGRWPELSERVPLDTRSGLSIRIDAGDDRCVRSLNLYGRRVRAFDATSEAIAEIFAAGCGAALRAAQGQAEAAQLHDALRTNRDIALAMGIIMAHRLVTRDEAFDLLRRASQRSHRKLAEIAADVAETGILNFGLDGRHSFEGLSFGAPARPGR